MSDAAALAPDAVTEVIVAEARALGFHRVGVTPARPPRHYDAYRRWLNRGFAADMAYMAAPEHIAGRADPKALLDSARAVVVVALAYDPGAATDDDAAAAAADNDAPIRGFVARYARGADYHGVLKRRLWQLAERVGEAVGRPVAARPCVDSAPVLERDLGEAAGIGFLAKNTMLIAPGLGSYVVLGELLLDVDAAPTAAAPPRARCGRCTACLDACPTGAFAGPYELDSRRCISYLTIEHRGPIPRALRPAVGTMIFGCDVCQQVCPFNAAAPARTPPDPELSPDTPERGAPDLLRLLSVGANQRRRYTDGTALRRASRVTLLRNVCVALGNAGDRRAVGPLAARLSDPSPLVRGHAAWALGALGAAEPLHAARATETDPDVRAEIDAALRDATDTATRRRLPVV